MNGISKLITPRRLAYLLIVFLATVSVFNLVVNRGLYYAYYHAAYELQVTGDVPGSLWAELRGFTGVTRFSAEQKSIRLQVGSTDEVNNMVQYIQNKGTAENPISVSITETKEWIPNDILMRTSWVTLLITAISGLYLYLTTWRKSLRANGPLVFRLISTYLFGAVLSAFFTLGILSLVSRVYELTEISTLALLLNVIVSLSFAYISSKLITPAVVSANSRLPKLYNVINLQLITLYKYVLVCSALVLVIVGVGLGIRFALDGLLLWLAIAFSVLSYSSLNIVLIDGFSGRWLEQLRAVRSSWKQRNKPRKAAPRHISTEAETSAKSAKNKAKKKSIQRRRGR